MNTTSPGKRAGGKKALLIGGGAPNSTLIAGALVAFIERGIEFDVISTSGAGALMGLMYVAPQGGNAKANLQKWGASGIANPIYDAFPVDYRVFNKPGPAADAFRAWLNANPLTEPYVNIFSKHAKQGLWSDWVNFWLATFTPSNLSPASKGLCAHLPFTEQAIDFKALRKVKPEVYINAYSLTREKMTIWGKDVITSDHMKAAFAFPFIYPPFHLNGEDYIEGASVDSLNFKALVCDDKATPGIARDIDTIVVFDILGNKKLLTKPDNLYDSWVGSIITPLVQLSKDDLKLFELVHNRDPHTGQPKRKLLKVPLYQHIPDDYWPKIFDWSHSNLAYLYELGYRAGMEFARHHQADLHMTQHLQAVA